MATAGTAMRSLLQIMRMPLGYDPANLIKVGMLLHRLWVSGETYEPLRNQRAIELRAAA